MKTRWVASFVLAGAVVVVAATPPVAMRVEVEPLRQLGGNTEVAVVIQIAPMDRGRIGSNAIVRIELDEGRVSSGSPMRAVKAEDDGSFRVVVSWPPGEHDLRVSIEDPNREDTGLWVGTVRIPELGQGAAVQEADEPESVSIPAPETMQPPAAVPEAAGEEPAVEMVPEETAAKTVAAPTAAATTTAPEAVKPTPPKEPEVAAAGGLNPEPAPEMTQSAPAVQPTESGVAEMPAAEPEAVARPEPEMPTTTSGREAAESAAAPRAVEEAPLVEPLRAEPPPGVVEPETVEPGGPVEELSEPAPVSAARSARYAEWERADPETREFSVIATRGREAARGLEAGDLRLRVGGSEVPIEELGDDGNSPLWLGLAIDVLAEDTGAWADTQGSLAPIVERAAAGRGRLFVASASGVGDWGAEPGSQSTASGSLPQTNVAGLVEAALERFEGVRGRSFLVVLTDGRNEPTKDEWQRASDAAGGAGVPILVIALWDSEFSQGGLKDSLTDKVRRKRL